MMKIKPVERPAKEIIEGFESIGTSTISDILDQMGLDCLVSGVRAVREGFTLGRPGP
jgi:hypothetical protein